MKTNLTKSEKVIAISAAVAISAFFIAFLKVSRGAQTSINIESGSTINYKMARPEQVYSEYNLDGREIDETYEGLPVERELAKAKVDKKKKDLVDKKIAEAKKKEEDKKKQAQVQKARAQAQAKLKQEREAQVRSQLSADNKNYKRDSVAGNQYSNGYAVPVNNNVVTPNEEQKAKTNKKTFAEWRNLLFSKPTSESLGLFITAFRKNEVTATEYQAMAQDLIEQSDASLKGLGLMALRAAPSLASLSQLAHLEPTALGNLQKYVEESLNAYLQNQNIQYLNQALMTQDKVLIVKSLNLLNTNLAKFGQGDFSSLVDARNRRDGEVVAFSMASYRMLLPALTQLSTSQDPDLAALAHQVTSYIQTSNNVAQF